MASTLRDRAATPLDDALPGEEGAPRELDPARLTRGEVRKRNLRDLAMVALGVGSLAIIAYDFFYRSTLTREQVLALELVDLAIVLVFAAEFVWRWSKEGWKARFVLRNWFDVVGLVPMVVTNFPLFRAFRLLRVFMVASRLLRMWAYVTGHQSAQRVFDKYREALVEEVTDRVMLQSIAMVEDVAARGGYLRALGDSLEQSREDIAAAALEGAHAKGLGKVTSLVPGVDVAVREAVLAAVDSAVVTLRSAEMQRTFEVSVRNLVAEMRNEIGRKAWREAYAPERDPLLRLPRPLSRGGPGEAAPPG
jgi:voltage-gated potassium channel